jgi:tight adherence protein B
MELFLIGIGIFIFVVIIIELVVYAVRNMRSTKRVKIRKRFRKYAYIDDGENGTDILKKRIYSEVPFFNSLLRYIPAVRKLDDLVRQANARYPMGFYILLSMLLAALGYVTGKVLLKDIYQSLLVMGICGILPIFYLKHLKRKRIEKFKRQLPDGLDLIARALKAGHAFSGGMKLAADEFEDPLGPEFTETLDEINFGVSVADALKNLTGRIDCEELRYFVVGVILQRETGGNLAELIETLANLIRERFKFDGKVRTLTAEGKLSAVILILLPLAVFGYLWITNPDFLAPLITEPAGKFMILGAIIMIIMGAFVMKKMVDIKV